MRNVHTAPTSPGFLLLFSYVVTAVRPGLWTGRYFFSTAWPPNWLRSAAIIFICGESS
ncbi:hypothetical protein GCM10020254_43680 [Streptomyces goshikiensis]